MEELNLKCKGIAVCIFLLAVLSINAVIADENITDDILNENEDIAADEKISVDINDQPASMENTVNEQDNSDNQLENEDNVLSEVLNTSDNPVIEKKETEDEPLGVWHEVEPEYNMTFNHPYAIKYGQNKKFTITSDIKDNNTYLIRYMYWDFAGNPHVLDYADIKLVNGTGSCSLNKLPVGEESLIYAFIKGTNNFVYEEVIDVNSLTKLTNAKDLTMYYGDGSKFSVKVYDYHGKLATSGVTVKFKIGNKYYYKKTNSKGIASLKITKLPKKYKITAIYRDAEISRTITVKKVLALKTVKVKKSASKLTLTASLKHGKTPIANKKITFKFNNKVYVTKTNKKGIAKVTIKHNTLKKLKAGKKVTYQATYLESTIKKTSIVK